MSKFSEAERQARREADRQKSLEAVQALQSSEGWQRWLACRRHFHQYSLSNQLLIAVQCPEATRVAGFKAWLKLGYCVRRGESALRIWTKRAVLHRVRARMIAACGRRARAPRGCRSAAVGGIAVQFADVGVTGSLPAVVALHLVRHGRIGCEAAAGRYRQRTAVLRRR